MAFSKWFWDVFPKRMTALWWVFMVVLAVVTMFWRDPVYAWFAGQPTLLIIGGTALLGLVFIGNYIPGVPNMLLPLLTGWAFAAGMSPVNSFLLTLAVWAIALSGSITIFNKARRQGELLVSTWRLNQSERYRTARAAFFKRDAIVLKSRVGRFAAYCGHINIIAGVERESPSAFTSEAMVGHILWTIQYVAMGFFMSLLLPYLGQIF